MKTDQITVFFVQKEDIAPAFGYAQKNCVTVRDDLSPRVTRFVIAHEKFHVKDRSTWGGWWGREIRANIWCSAKDPIGFMATVCASCTKERLQFYFERIRLRA